MYSAHRFSIADAWCICNESLVWPHMCVHSGPGLAAAESVLKDPLCPGKGAGMALPLSHCDSIRVAGAVELRDALSTKYGTDMPPTLTFDHPTITAMAAHLAESLQPSEYIDQVCGTSTIPFTRLYKCTPPWDGCDTSARSSSAGVEALPASSVVD
jgi:hypothetical protein